VPRLVPCAVFIDGVGLSAVPLGINHLADGLRIPTPNEKGPRRYELRGPRRWPAWGQMECVRISLRGPG
jgi:hypothetical protein